MAIIIWGKEVWVDGEKIYEAPATIDQAAILDDGIVVLYNSSEIVPPKSPVGASGYREPTKQELFLANKNVLRIDRTGNTSWIIKAGDEPTPHLGYRALMELPDENRWVIYSGSGRYEHYIDLETGETTESR